MKCWVCSRSARGFGYSDGRYAPGEPRRYPLDWVFCSQRCQNAFHALYGNWIRMHDGMVQPSEDDMINLTEIEQAAMTSCLKAFGDAADKIGFHKALGAYSRDEALQIIRAIVECWTSTMTVHHESTKYPPVRGLSTVPDPLIESPFAELKDDLPWEDTP